MAFPDRPHVALGSSTDRRDKPAYLVKFPQDVWERILAATSSGLQVLHEGGSLSIQLPDGVIDLDPHPLGATTEIYSLSDELKPLAQATTRLAVPFAVASGSKAGSKASAQPDPTDKSRRTRPDRVNGIPGRLAQDPGIPLARSHSSPVVGSSSKIGNGSGSNVPATAATPTIPLKTRVVQLLALGSASAEDIVNKMGGAEADVMRVVKVVGRQVAENPPRYSLQPSQYTKIKVADWKYTREELAGLRERAKEAFDDLELPMEAEERMEMERKIQEALNTATSASPPPSLPAVESKPASPEHVVAPIVSGTSTASATRREATPVHTGESTKSEPSSFKPNKTRPGAAKGKGMVAREMAKFKAAQARSSSASGVRGNGRGTPVPAPARSDVSVKMEVPVKVEKRETPERVAPKDSRKPARDNTAGAEKAGKRKRERHPSPTFTSSEDEEEKTRGRPKLRGSRPKSSQPETNDTPPPTNIDSSAGTKRKPPPQPLDLSRQPVSTPSTTASERPDDPEDLRDRYEELYPAYQQMTAKLIALHRAAEGLELGDTESGIMPDTAELERMVKKWERWHNELTGIRRWFGSV